MVKCVNCGKELPKKQNICPECGKDNTLVQQLKDAKIPKELKHIPLQKMSKRIEHIRFFGRQKKMVLAVIFGLVIVAIGGFSWFTHRDEVGNVHNFHDDLVEVTKANANGNSLSNLINGGYLAAYGTDLYTVSENKLYKIAMTLESKQSSEILNVSNLNVMNGTIFYIDHNNQDYITILDTSNKNKNVSKYRADMLLVSGNYVYFKGKGERSAIYQMKTDFSENKAMTQSGCLTFNIVGDWLYYSTNDGIYKVPSLGGEVAKLIDGYFPYFIATDEFIYYCDAAGFVSRMLLNGEDTVTLTNEPVNSFVISDNYMIYATKDGGIFKQDIETKTLTQLSVDKARDLQLSSTWIYYRLVENDTGCFVSIDENSNKVIPVYSIKDK